MPNDTVHEPSEYEEKPGQASSRAARQDEALARATESSADPIPPVGRPYNGWRRWLSIQGNRPLVLIPGGVHWRDEAACVDQPADMFPDDTDIPGNERARAVCGRCPVTEQCPLFAFASCEPWGVSGGLTSAERQEE